MNPVKSKQNNTNPGLVIAVRVLEVAEGNKEDIRRGRADAGLIKPHHQKRRGLA